MTEEHRLRKLAGAQREVINAYDAVRTLMAGLIAGFVKASEEYGLEINGADNHLIGIKALDEVITQARQRLAALEAGEREGV